MTGPVDPLRRLGQLSDREATAAGFDLHQFLVVPDLEGTADRVRLVLSTDPERGVEPEESEDDVAIREMLAATHAAEEEQRAERAREALQERLRNPRGGIL